MDDLSSQLQAALREAMKNRDVMRRNTLRLMLNAIKQEQIDSKQDLSAEDMINVLHKEAKQRRESIQEYDKGGRADLVQKEQAELAIIEEFLPRQLSVEEITAIVKEAIDQTGASSVKEMGKVMGLVMSRAKGVADGKLVNQIVREQLSS